MSDSLLVRALVSRLSEAGYELLPTPFRIATVAFEFTAALRGSRSRALDLVLVVDTTTGDFGDRRTERVRQRVEALGRALDVTGSRLAVTLILAGAALAGQVEGLAELCRVLIVDDVTINSDAKPATPAAAAQLDDRIRLLLPLDIPARPAGLEGSSGTMTSLRASLEGKVDADLVERLLSASDTGEKAVSEALGRALNMQLLRREPE